MKILLPFAILLLLLTACKSGDSTVQSEAAQQTKALVENGPYEVKFNWANPMTTNEMVQLSNANLLPIDSRAGQINLIGTANYIRKRGDSLEVYLPYYGTRQMAPIMGNNNVAIEFEGVPEKYEVTYNEKKGRSEVNFVLKEGSERYQVYMNVGPSKRTTLRVNSSQRTPIKYTGELGRLTPKKEQESAN